MFVIDESEHAVMIFEVLVLLTPRECASVLRISVSGKACFISIVDARHTRERILKRREHFDFADRRLFVLFRRHHSHDPLAVMAPDKVESSIEILPRIVFSQTHEAVSGFACAYRIVYIVEQDGPQRIVHRSVKFIAREILSSFAIADFVARVFPDFADEHTFRIGDFDASTHGFDESIRKLVRHIEAPSRSTKFEPVSSYSVFTEYVVLVIAVHLIYFRKIFDSPP